MLWSRDLTSVCVLFLEHWGPGFAFHKRHACVPAFVQLEPVCWRLCLSRVPMNVYVQFYKPVRRNVLLYWSRWLLIKTVRLPFTCCCFRKWRCSVISSGLNLEVRKLTQCYFRLGCNCEMYNTKIILPLQTFSVAVTLEWLLYNHNEKNHVVLNVTPCSLVQIFDILQDYTLFIRVDYVGWWRQGNQNVPYIFTRSHDVTFQKTRGLHSLHREKFASKNNEIS